MNVQHDLYDEVIGRWVGRVSERCRLYEDSLAVRTVAGTVLDHTERFDHRTVQGVHDTLAACFRFRHAAATPLLDRFDDDEYWRREWSAWAQREWETLLDQPAFFQAMARAVGLSNTTSGCAAEQKANEFLHMWYDDVPWLRTPACDEA